MNYDEIKLQTTQVAALTLLDNFKPGPANLYTFTQVGKEFICTTHTRTGQKEVRFESPYMLDPQQLRNIHVADIVKDAHDGATIAQNVLTQILTSFYPGFTYSKDTLNNFYEGVITQIKQTNPQSIVTYTNLVKGIDGVPGQPFIPYDIEYFYPESGIDAKKISCRHRNPTIITTPAYVLDTGSNTHADTCFPGNSFQNSSYPNTEGKGQIRKVFAFPY
jgi:hypothetical protein